MAAGTNEKSTKGNSGLASSKVPRGSPRGAAWRAREEGSAMGASGCCGTPGGGRGGRRLPEGALTMVLQLLPADVDHLHTAEAFPSDMRGPSARVDLGLWAFLLKK